MRRLTLIFALVLILALCGCSREPGVYETVPNPTAVITLTDGRVMNLELFFQDAPNTVANFCELANAGFYDGLEIYRVLPSVLIQSGDPIGDGTGNAGYYIQGEFSENGIENGVSHIRGTISMSRQKEGNDTASSQFFILYNSFPEYDGKYAAFGRLTDEGSYAVLDDIATTAVDGSNRPLGACPTIQTIRADTKGYGLEPAKIEIEKEEENGGNEP